ncbi:hypothetical protein [Buchananella felis]|uniref:hypothetical protein n=1 Tax=Buchananella felis TaxID=3231492 RepID=UPI003527E204
MDAGALKERPGTGVVGAAGRAVVCLVSLGGSAAPALGEVGAALAERLGACLVDARPFAFQGARGGFTWAEVDQRAEELDGKALLAALPPHPSHHGVGHLSSGVRGAVGQALRVPGAPALAAALLALGGRGRVVVLEPAPQCVPAGALWLGVAGRRAHLWPDLPARALALARMGGAAGAACLVMCGPGPGAWDRALAELCSQHGSLEVVRVRRPRWGSARGGQLGARRVAGALAQWVAEVGARIPGDVSAADTATASCAGPPFRFLPVRSESLAPATPTGESQSVPADFAVSWLPGGAVRPARRERHQARRAA